MLNLTSSASPNLNRRPGSYTCSAGTGPRAAAAAAAAPGAAAAAASPGAARFFFLSFGAARGSRVWCQVTLASTHLLTSRLCLASSLKYLHSPSSCRQARGSGGGGGGGGVVVAACECGVLGSSRRRKQCCRGAHRKCWRQLATTPPVPTFFWTSFACASPAACSSFACSTSLSACTAAAGTAGKGLMRAQPWFVADRQNPGCQPPGLTRAAMAAAQVAKATVSLRRSTCNKKGPERGMRAAARCQQPARQPAG